MFLTVNGVRLFYESKGQGSPFLLLHGNGEEHSIFDRIMEPLSKKYRVFALDSRDHGQSEKTGVLSYDTMADDVIAFCRGLDLTDPLLYGFSDGGIVGLMVGYKEPALLSRLVVSGANLTPDGLQPWFRLACRVGYFLHPEPRVNMMLTQPQIQEESLHKIKAPTLVLAGQHDLIRRAHSEKIACAVPGAQLHILKGESHSSYVVHSNKVLQYL